MKRLMTAKLLPLAVLALTTAVCLSGLALTESHAAQLRQKKDQDGDLPPPKKNPPPPTPTDPELYNGPFNGKIATVLRQKGLPGPKVGGTTFLHGYTSSFGLFRPGRS